MGGDFTLSLHHEQLDVVDPCGLVVLIIGLAPFFGGPDPASTNLCPSFGKRVMGDGWWRSLWRSGGKGWRC